MEEIKKEDDRKPTVMVGFGFLPVVMTNFTTDHEGNNEIVNSLQGAYAEISSIMIERMRQVTVDYCQHMGIEYIEMEDAMVKKAIKASVDSGKESTRSIYSVSKGEFITDDDFYKHIVSGGSGDS